MELQDIITRVKPFVARLDDDGNPVIERGSLWLSCDGLDGYPHEHLYYINALVDIIGAPECLSCNVKPLIARRVRVDIEAYLGTACTIIEAFEKGAIAFKTKNMIITLRGAWNFEGNLQDLPIIKLSMYKGRDQSTAALTASAIMKEFKRQVTLAGLAPAEIKCVKFEPKPFPMSDCDFLDAVEGHNYIASTLDEPENMIPVNETHIEQAAVHREPIATHNEPIVPTQKTEPILVQREITPLISTTVHNRIETSPAITLLAPIMRERPSIPIPLPKKMPARKPTFHIGPAPIGMFARDAEKRDNIAKSTLAPSRISLSTTPKPSALNTYYQEL